MHKTYTPKLEATLPNSLSTPSMPTCFGTLTSSGDVIKSNMKEISKARKKPGLAALSRDTSVFPTKNIRYETKLMAQTLRKNPSADMSSNTKLNTLRAAPTILAPVSNRVKLEMCK